jgi:hypothetical protein
MYVCMHACRRFRCTCCLGLETRRVFLKKKNQALRHTTTGTVTTLHITTDLPRCWTVQMFYTNSIYSTLGVHRFFPQNLEATSKFLALEPRQNEFLAEDPQILGSSHKIYSPGSGSRNFVYPALRNKILLRQIRTRVFEQCHMVFIKA